MRPFAFLLTVVLLSGCATDDTPEEPIVCSEDCDDEADPDADGDGFPASVDCDDAAANVFPGAEESCNGVDDDCDDAVDEDATDGSTFFADADGDGFGDASQTTVACEAPEGFVTDSTDCDDGNDLRAPGLVEVCDGVDNDCDNTVDANLVPRDHASLQEAFDALPDGSTVCLSPGTYTGGLDVSDRSLTIAGAGTPDTPTRFELTGLAAPLFVAHGPDTQLTIRGIEVTGADVLGPPPGLFLNATDATVHVEEVRFVGNRMNVLDGNRLSGGLVRSERGELTLKKVTVDDFVVAIQGENTTFTESEIFGGFLQVNETKVVIEELVASNVSLAGPVDWGMTLRGLLLAGTGGSVAADGLTIRGATVTRAGDLLFRMEGGLMNLTGMDLDVRNVDVRDTTSTSSLPASDFTIRGSLLYLDHVSGLIEGVDLHDNTADHQTAGSGGWLEGLMYSSNAEDLRLERLTASGNLMRGTTATNAFTTGGAIHIESGTQSLRWVDVRNNMVESSRRAGGGAVSVGTATVSIANSIFAGNLVQTFQDADGVAQGGALRVVAGNVTLDHVDIYGNAVSAPTAQGGGIHLSGSLTATHTNVVANELTGTALQGSGLFAAAFAPLSWSYNNTWMNTGAETFFGTADPTGTNGNLAVDPAYVNASGPDPLAWDFALQPSSPVSDAGNASGCDVDGSVCAFGAYGGPDGGW